MSEILNKIENHNCGISMCMERTCSQDPVWFAETTYNGIKIHVALCDEHKAEVEKYLDKELVRGLL